MNTMAERLIHARTIRRLSQTKLASLAGCSQGAISQIETGVSDNSRYDDQIADALQVRRLWLVFGSGPMEMPRYEDIEPGETLSIGETAAEYNANEYVGVALLDGFLSKGAGGQDVSPEVVKYLHFRRDWIRAQGWRPSALWAISSRGESMPGLVDDTDVLLVNTDDKWPLMGRSPRERVFAIKSPSGDLAKELIYDERNLRLTVRSWNPDKGRWPDEHYGREDLESSLFIMGRIVWRGGVL